jgi:hypothetical protein
MYCCKRLRWTLLLIYLISARVAFLLTSKVLQRLPIISNTLRLNSSSSSRKEEDTVTAPLDRPILVLKVLVRAR